MPVKKQLMKEIELIQQKIRRGLEMIRFQRRKKDKLKEAIQRKIDSGTVDVVKTNK